MNIIAHRGYSDLAPENTLPSFDLAIKKGFNIFELDIQLTKDKVPIVFHDYDLNRICGLNLKINEIEFNSIEDFDVGLCPEVELVANVDLILLLQSFYPRNQFLQLKH